MQPAFVSEEEKGRMVHFLGLLSFSGPMSITLFAPELLWPEPGVHPAPPACPALERLLARGNLRRAPAQTSEDTLCALFGHPERPALAALRRHGEDDAPATGGRRWLCADPVHLRFDDDRLILADATRLGISTEEADALVAALNDEFPELGRFHAAAGGRWYLDLADTAPTARLDAPPLSAVAGRHVGTLLPDVLADRAWRSRFTALQTALHAHPVNQARTGDGRLPINSLWLWGDQNDTAATGDTPANAGWQRLWSDDTLARGLARSVGLKPQPIPESAATLLAEASTKRRSLVVLNELVTPASYDDADAWRDALARLDADWFAPLAAAVRAGRVDRLELIVPAAYGTFCWTIRRPDFWRFWKKNATLASVATRLAEDSQ